MTRSTEPARRGRPPRDGTPAAARVSVRLTPDERAALRRLAAEHRCPEGDVIRIALRDFAEADDERHSVRRYGAHRRYFP